MMDSKQGHGEPNPTWIPAGNEVTRRIAEKIDGVAGGTWGELFNIPLTAHFLGGAAIGDSRRARRHRPVPPGVRLPDAVGHGRRGDLGEPRRQPVAVDHRPGRAGGVVVAEQGRGRPAAGAGRALPAARTRSRRSIRWCPRDAPGALRRLPIEPVRFGRDPTPLVRQADSLPRGRSAGGPSRCAGTPASPESSPARPSAP